MLSNTITIGNEYLQQKVKRDYSNHKVALIREFLQNSIDAGSNNIHFDLDTDNRILVVKDDGCGMDSDIMVNCLFNIGGSHKEHASVGGFGVAKLILLFQHEYFKITSYRNGKRYDVNGSGSQYSDITEVDEEGVGTTIEIKISDTWAIEESYSGSDYDTFNSFQYDAESFLKECTFDCNIFWNGDGISSKEKGELVRRLEWCDIYSKKGSTSNFVNIRIRGMKMFDSYVSGIEDQLTVELTKNSLAILTSNRDSLRYNFKKELDAILGELNVDKKSFGKIKGQTFIYRGKSSSLFNTCWDSVTKFKENIIDTLNIKRDQANSINDSETVSNINQQIDNIEMELINEKVYLQEMLDDEDSTETQQTISMERVSKMLEVMQVKSNICGVQVEIESELDKIKEEVLTSVTDYDFYVQVEDDLNTIPKGLDPKKGLYKKHVKTAKLWKHAINYLCKALDKDINYRIGWVLDSTTEAAYKCKNDEHYFLINPISKRYEESESKRVKLIRILRACAHEVTHMLGHQYHDENFMLAYDRVLEYVDKISLSAFERESYYEDI